MKYPILVLAAVTLAMAACTPSEQEAAETETEQAGDALGEEASQIGDAIESGIDEAASSETAQQIGEEAGQLGEAIEEGARDAASEVDQATDEMAADARRREAEREATAPVAQR